MTRENKFCAVPSEITSLNQNAIEANRVINPVRKIYPPLEKPCIANTPDVVKVNNDRSQFCSIFTI